MDVGPNGGTPGDRWYQARTVFTEHTAFRIEQTPVGIISLVPSLRADCEKKRGNWRGIIFHVPVVQPAIVLHQGEAQLLSKVFRCPPLQQSGELVTTAANALGQIGRNA